MKASNSLENAIVTPNKKKLKQARLPFKILSDVSPKPTTPLTRKRKHSVTDVETTTKGSKICKENDLVEEPVVISDEDSKDAMKSNKDIKLPNPYVKLVDAARKKKIQKLKKKKSDKKTPPIIDNGCHEHQNTHDNNGSGIELMDVDDISEKEEDNTSINSNKLTEKHETLISTTLSTNKTISSAIAVKDSNNSYEAGGGSKNDTNSNISDENSSDILENKNAEANDQKSNKNSPDKNEDLKLLHLENEVTPKRSMRSRTKENNNNKFKDAVNELIDSKLSLNSTHNDSNCSVSLTPKSTRKLSLTDCQENVSLNESTASATLTPKQMQKKLDSAKKKEERDRKRQQEKEERAKLKQEKEEQKKREREEKEEARKKEKEEKEEQKRKEREEKERQKELEKKQREEKEEQKRKEKEEKEEQKRKEREAKEEERKKKQEALELEKQEQEHKKKKAAEAFVNFFVPKQKSEKDQATVCSVSNSMLSNFSIKNDMRLAPLFRANLSDVQKQHLDDSLVKQEESLLYLKSLKDGVFKPLSSGKTWPLSDKDDDDDDVMIVEDADLLPIDGAGEILSSEAAPREKLRPKLLAFHENRRPPYWGTWRKKSTSIKPRNPFGQDQKQLDYEVDSDEEWEEEQEGESIDGSAAGSDDEQECDEYEVDNVVFVPHGYLSDEEATMDEDDVLSLSPETQQARLKHLEDEFESEMKKPTEKLKPRMYGLLWETNDCGKPDKCVDPLWNYFRKMSMIMNDPIPLLLPSNEPEEGEKKKVKKKKQGNPTEGEEKSPKSEKKKKSKPDDKESKTPKLETKKTPIDIKKNQPGINMFLTKVKSS